MDNIINRFVALKTEIQNTENALRKARESTAEPIKEVSLPSSMLNSVKNKGSDVKSWFKNKLQAPRSTQPVEIEMQPMSR